jgi:flagellin
MAQSINTNVMSLNAQRNLNGSQGAMSLAVQRLSSGLRVNSSKDDAAGLAIAERMSAQVRGMNVGIRNANDAISLAQTADGALGQISELAQRMRELAVQSSNATNGTGDRANLDTEYQQLALELTRTIAGASFNGKAILAADAGAQTFQVGAKNATTDQITVTTTDLSANADVTAVTGGSVSTDTAARTAMDSLDTLLDTVNTQRATYGAIQNRFSSVISTLQVAVENQSAARGRIMDADFATETANLTRSQVLQQAGQAMLSQANASTSNVLSLLRNL